MLVVGATAGDAQRARAFDVHEATIADIQRALQSRRITTVGVVEQYLQRIKAYNGTCVNEPQGILGPVTTIPRAGQINALSTLNLRPAARERWGFDARKARSLTDRVDSARRHAGRARNRRGPGPRVRAHRTAGRPASRRGDRHQGSVRHERHAHDVRRRRAVRERSAAGRRDVRGEAARRGRHHPGQGEPRGVRGGRRAQLVRRHVLQSVRHRARAGHVERRIGQRPSPRTW